MPQAKSIHVTGKTYATDGAGPYLSHQPDRHRTSATGHKTYAAGSAERQPLEPKWQRQRRSYVSLISFIIRGLTCRLNWARSQCLGTHPNLHRFPQITFATLQFCSLPFQVTFLSYLSSYFFKLSSFNNLFKLSFEKSLLSYLLQLPYLSYLVLGTF